MFSTDSGRDDAGPSACSSEGESLEIVATGESVPLAIGVVYMKFFVDTADVAKIMKSGQPILKAFLDDWTLDDWTKTGQSIL
jgi:hypothetical protein